MDESQQPMKARPDTIVVIFVIDKDSADRARSSLEKTISELSQTGQTHSAPFIGLKDTDESYKARELAIDGLMSKMSEILPKLGIETVDAKSSNMGPTLYFTGKSARVKYPHNTVVCTLAFGPHKDAQVPVGHEVPELQSGWSCCWAGPRTIEWKGNGGGVGAILTVPIASMATSADSAR